METMIYITLQFAVAQLTNNYIRGMMAENSS